MRNQIIKLDEKTFKVMAVTEEAILLSSKNHSTIDALKASTEKSGLLESTKSIPVNGIKELFYNEKGEDFTIRYEQNGKAKKQSLNLDQKKNRAPLLDEIARLRDFQKEVKEESKTKPMLLNLLGVVVTAAFTWVFYGMAQRAAEGEHYTASGRRKGIKQLVASAVEALGPTGVLIIGALAFLYMVYLTHKRFNNPASEVLYR